MAQNNDIVSFKDVQKCYPPGEALGVRYDLQTEYSPASRDWVGLFQVGWTSSRDYYTFEWAPTPDDNKGMAKFAGRRLPPEDTHFYQFCYVSSNGRVRGASPPFQFSTASLMHNVEDLELVEVPEDSLMVLQNKTTQEGEVQRQLSNVQVSLGAMELEKKQLSEQMVEIEAEKHSIVVAKDAQLTDLQAQLQIKIEAEERLVEKLAISRAETNEIMAVKNDDEAKYSLLVSQLTTKDQEVVQQSAMITDLKEQNRELKGQIQIRDSQVDDLTQLATARGQEKEQLIAEVETITEEVMQNKGQIAEMMEQLEHKTIEIEQQNFNSEDARRFTDESKRKLDESERKLDEVQQELNIANENISELMGQGGGIVIDRPVTTLPEPPTAPAAPLGTVDSSVYTSLLEAFENVQGYYEDVKKENVQLQIKVDEMMARVETCKMTYEELATTHSDVMKEKRADVVRIRELEDQIEDFTQGCGTAVTELSARKNEIKQNNAAIEALEGTLNQVQLDYDGFRDRHDTEVHRRVEQCDLTKAALDNKIKELTTAQNEISKLQRVNEHLKVQLEGLKSTAKPPTRTCPVCSTKFPVRMKQQDYENHVQGHFK